MSKFINSKFIQISIAVLVGVVCLYFVIGSFNWIQIWQSLQKTNLLKFFSGAILTLHAFFFLRTIRWYLLLKSENLKVPFGRLYLYNSVSIGISTVTPFQAGEAVKVELLRKYGIERAAGYTIFFLEKSVDLAIIAALGIVGLSAGLDSGVSPFYFYLLAFGLVAGFFVAVKIGFLLPFERLTPIKNLLREKWRQKRMLTAVFLVTVCSWATAILGWKITLASVSIDINFLQSISLVSLTVLLTIISFVPGAVGVSELGITAILTRMGVELSAAQTGAIALRAYALTLIILALLHWIILRLVPKNAENL